MAGKAGRSGGGRSGAGRKPTALKHLTPIQAAERRIADRLPLLVDKLFELAEGVKVKDVAPDGSVDYYTEPPHFKALEYLTCRVMGKPTERYEHEITQLSDADLVARVTAALGGDGPAGPDPARA